MSNEAEKCKTCGGARMVMPAATSAGGNYFDRPEPCPDCQGNKSGPSPSPAPSKPEGVKKYRWSYKNGMIEEDGSPRHPCDSPPVVLASAYDAKCAEVERLGKELNRVTRGDVSNVITTLGDALTHIANLQSQLAEAQRDVERAAAWGYEQGATRFIGDESELSATAALVAKEVHVALTGREGT